GLPLQVESLSGSIVFDDNNFKIGELKVGDQQLGQVTGEGKLALNPPSLVSGAITAQIAPEGQYTRVNRPGMFEGWLGGTVSIAAAPRPSLLTLGQGRRAPYV